MKEKHYPRESSNVNNINYDGYEENSHKPRRLEDESAQYLLQLEPKLLLLEKQNHKISHDRDSETDIFLSNVIDEIKQRLGSAMSDRRTNMIMEKICYLSSLQHLLIIMTSIAPYGVFLSENRHSSHCLQALFARLGYILKHHGVEDELIEMTKTSVIECIEPILGEICMLSKDLNGSHVIRAILCCLSGLPPIAERKGKGSKHQHSIPFSEPLEKLLEPEKFYLNTSMCYEVPDEFYEAISTATTLLVQLPEEELVTMIYDPTSAAVLGLLERILSAPNLILGGQELIDSLNKRVIGYDESKISWLYINQNIFDMSKDRAGSYFLEAMMECCEKSLFLTLYTNTFDTMIKQFAEDNSANFVLQAVFRRMSAQLSEFNQETLENVFETTHRIFTQLVLKIPTEFNTIIGRKGGVVLWMIEVALTISKIKLSSSSSFRQSTTDFNTNWIDIIGKAVVMHYICVSDNLSHTNKSTEQEFLSEDSMEIKLKRYFEKMFQNLSETNDQMLSRHMNILLRSVNVSFIGQIVSNAILSLSSTILLSIATSGPMSRLLLDPILDLTMDSSEPGINKNRNTSNCSVLANTMLPVLSDMACHYIGQHIFRKLYQKSSSDMKEILVKTLVGSRNKLIQSKEGRASLSISNADLYYRNPSEWKQLIHRQSKASTLLTELETIGTSGNSNKKRKINSIVLGTNEENDKNIINDETDTSDRNDNNTDRNNQAKRKRRRKRPNKSNQSNKEVLE